MAGPGSEVVISSEQIGTATGIGKSAAYRAVLAACARRRSPAQPGGLSISLPGDVLYAVKCNPEPSVLRAIWAGGVRHFDCASLAEAALVRELLPAGEIHYSTHLVKSRPAIRDGFDVYGVTDFAFDSADELAKILQETVPVGLVGDPPVLGLFVRLALPEGRRGLRPFR